MTESSRRNFLLAGLAAPAVASASRPYADGQKHADPPRSLAAAP